MSNVLADSNTNFPDYMLELSQRESGLSNSAQLKIISHITTLATLTITVTGVLASNLNEQFSNDLKFMFIIIMVLEFLAIFFGVIDYWQTIKFHENAAKEYIKVVEEIISQKAITIKQQHKIHDNHLDELNEGTNRCITKAMVFFSLTGLFVMILVFYGYFFDVPFIK